MILPKGPYVFKAIGFVIGIDRWNACLAFIYTVKVLSSTTTVTRKGVYRGIFLICLLLYGVPLLPLKNVTTKSFVCVKYMNIDTLEFIYLFVISVIWSSDGDVAKGSAIAVGGGGVTCGPLAYVLYKITRVVAVESVILRTKRSTEKEKLFIKGYFPMGSLSSGPYIFAVGCFLLFQYTILSSVEETPISPLAPGVNIKTGYTVKCINTRARKRIKAYRTM